MLEESRGWRACEGHEQTTRMLFEGRWGETEHKEGGAMDTKGGGKEDTGEPLEEGFQQEGVSFCIRFCFITIIFGWNDH